MLVAIDLVADESDLLDAGGVALVHGKGDVDAVALDRRDGGGDLGAVQAARQVLALQFLLGAIDHGAVEDARFGQADFLERLGQLFLVEFLDAGKIDAGNRRTLLQHHHQDVALGFDAHILEEAGRIQRLDGFSAFFIGEGFADPHRQVAEHRARLGALDAFDADILDDKRFGSKRLPGTESKGGNGNQATGKRWKGNTRRM